MAASTGMDAVMSLCPFSCIARGMFAIVFWTLCCFSLVLSAEEEEWQGCEIFLAPSGTGRGVYAARSFKKGEMVDMAPGIIPMNDDFALKNSVLDDYTYGYGRFGGDSFLQLHAVMFGMDLFYNHHPEPNLKYTSFGREPDPNFPHVSNALGFTAIRDIFVGEQLFSTYGEDDGGKEWFRRRGITMESPKESHIAPEDLSTYKSEYCSKIQAGIGVPTWKDRILPILRDDLPFSVDLSRLAPFDAGIGDAKAKVPISRGERIEISTALVMSRKLVRGSALGAVVISWDDLTEEHQNALRTLRENGQMILQYQGHDTDWRRMDRFQSFEDLGLLPNAGNIGMVRRVGDGPSNCRLVIHPEGEQGSVGVTVELIATKDIPVGEILKLNLPRAGSTTELKALEKELQLTGMPHYAGSFSGTNDEL